MGYWRETKDNSLYLYHDVVGIVQKCKSNGNNIPWMEHQMASYLDWKMDFYWDWQLALLQVHQKGFDSVLWLELQKAFLMDSL